MPKRPNSRRNLDIAIERIAGRGQDFVQARTVMADAVVAQMLPDGAVKGGSALKLRFGDEGTRFSEDLDTARASHIEEYIGALGDALEAGWQGFTGAVVRREPATPAGIPASYVMQPYDVKLSYLGKSWVTVQLEVGHNEIGDADEPDMIVPQDAARLFEALGFDPPSAIPVMRLSHQISQKLHGLSEGGSRRAHDLVDLQLIFQKGDANLAETRSTCERLFAYRGQQSWPPVVEVGTNWESLYAEAAEGLAVIQDVGDAVEWANRFIEEIAK
ncbi:nucleotidyl transferase AbiEii/AbiGii toxin family protein [Adlercreutzia mucosicola]|uniref:nucleotidyl transferase AbiEii/AbiGii toxin family protein n=2 Tax=Adlercreutzia mucosicola TaxID=580026 RepID=UPI00048408EB|nr:nucleotidyl transferase AbiEii/AbiGii toxin family protein [Adlercreutzia mucosicola]MCR2034727.1 nucleotidyl transferase AbiEii/AbiGii toxin family protein [Adlercreutzia mucosicola]